MFAQKNKQRISLRVVTRCLDNRYPNRYYYILSESASISVSFSCASNIIFNFTTLTVLLVEKHLGIMFILFVLFIYLFIIIVD